MKLIAQLFPLLFTVLFYSCGTTEPGRSGTFYTGLADVACTECWLKVETHGMTLPIEAKLFRNGELRQQTTIEAESIVICDSLLLPSTTYQYKISLGSVTSEEIRVTTLDTLKHNLEWKVYEIGFGFSNSVYDVFCLSEENVYVVGNFYKENDAKHYGLLTLENNEWLLSRLQPFSKSNDLMNLQPTGVFAFSEDDIWFASGSVFHWDGEKFTNHWLTYFSTQPNPFFSEGQFARKIWGTSNRDIYVCGDKGALAHYDGSNWRKIETGVTLNFNDIWGISYNDNLNKSVLLAAADFSRNNNMLFEITEKFELRELKWQGSELLLTVWAKSYVSKFAGGSNLYVNFNGDWNIEMGFENSQLLKIRGRELNDIFLVGSNNLLMHYNGIHWRNTLGLSGEYFGENFSNLSVCNKAVVVAGDGSGKIRLLMSKL